jgi:transketolase
MQDQELPSGWDLNLPQFPADKKGLATRDSSGEVLNKIAEQIPWLMGGDADLAPSTKTTLKFEGAGDFEAQSYQGRNLHFGIREHAMGAISNGLTLSNIKAFNATFLVFSDYQKPAIRLSALMQIPTMFIYTHDSIGVGEDGPTHQPVEQLIGLRSIPGLTVFRPADANEVTECWRVIMGLKTGPSALVLTRQSVPTLDRSRYASASGVSHGAYILAAAKNPQVILMATGSEVHLCIEAHEKLTAAGIRSHVISMPSWELFEKQSQEYKDQVLPPSVLARVSVEQASTMGWHRYVGLQGTAIGMTGFGASAPFKDLLKYFGFTVEHILEAVHQQLKKEQKRDNR